jgi:hypothetical protein
MALTLSRRLGDQVAPDVPSLAAAIDVMALSLTSPRPGYGVLHVWNLDTKSETRAIDSSDGSGKMVVNLVFSADGEILGFVLIVGQCLRVRSFHLPYNAQTGHWFARRYFRVSLSGLPTSRPTDLPTRLTPRQIRTQMGV